MTQDEIEYLIERLEESFEKQNEAEGEIAAIPVVSYCFECDTIALDASWPDGCINHPTVSSDGYEHDGIRSALTALQYFKET